MHPRNVWRVLPQFDTFSLSFSSNRDNNYRQIKNTGFALRVLCPLAMSRTWLQSDDRKSRDTFRVPSLTPLPACHYSLADEKGILTFPFFFMLFLPTLSWVILQLYLFLEYFIQNLRPCCWWILSKWSYHFQIIEVWDWKRFILLVEVKILVH